MLKLDNTKRGDIIAILLGIIAAMLIFMTLYYSYKQRKVNTTGGTISQKQVNCCLEHQLGDSTVVIVSTLNYRDKAGRLKPCKYAYNQKEKFALPLSMVTYEQAAEPTDWHEILKTSTCDGDKKLIVMETYELWPNVATQ
jgi:hypothetical protein